MIIRVDPDQKAHYVLSHLDQSYLQINPLLSTPMGVDCSTGKWFRHGSTIISYPQCSLTFLHERYLHRCREQSVAIHACAMSAVGIDVVWAHKHFAYRVVSTVSTDIVSSHTKYCRMAYGITR